MQITPYKIYAVFGEKIMNQYLSCSDLKDKAREKLRGKYGSAMLVSPILTYVVTFALVFPVLIMVLMPLAIASALAQSPMNQPFLFIVTAALILLCTVLAGVLNTGTALFYLNIACNKSHSISDLLYGFRWQFKKSLSLSAVNVALSTLFMLPNYVFSYLELFSYQPEWSTLSSISYIVGGILFYPIQLCLSQTYYLLLDFPQHSTIELLKLSNRIMKGHKGRLFYIHLSFLPLELLSLCSIYIGYLWLIPYQNMTQALFFLDIMKPKPNTTYDPFEA